jgi:hypothetical protein
MPARRSLLRRGTNMRCKSSYALLTRTSINPREENERRCSRGRASVLKSHSKKRAALSGRPFCRVYWWHFAIKPILLVGQSQPRCFHSLVP